MKQKSEFLVDSLHIFVLFSFALVQPLFDLLSRSAVFFVARHSEPVDVILLVLILIVLLPTLVVLVEWMVGLLGRWARKGGHSLIVASLVAAIALPVLNKIGGVSGTVLLVGAIFLGVAVTIAYIRFHPVRIFLTVLSPALLLFPGLFLFYSPVSKVVFRSGDSITTYPKIDATTPVVMVVFDEFSITSLMDEHRQIDPILYHNFAALARNATLFLDARTINGSTDLSIPAILTGNYPSDNADQINLPTVTDYPQNLFTLLGGSYDFKIIESISQLCPDQLNRIDPARESFAGRIISLLS